MALRATGSGAVVPADRWHDIFEDRYGAGSLARLVAQLKRPCITFADIAKEFGVSRERVRQWQLAVLPDAPRGHERQRLCARYKQKRRLLEDPLFRSFYAHARPHLDRSRIELVRSRDGYRARLVQIDGRTIAIHDASGSVLPRAVSERTYALAAHRGSASFVYYRLANDEFLLLPADKLARGAMFLDVPDSPYWRFKNSFDALGRNKAHATRKGRSLSVRQLRGLPEHG